MAKLKSKLEEELVEVQKVVKLLYDQMSENEEETAVEKYS